jgi:hypothetical protein
MKTRALAYQTAAIILRSALEDFEGWLADDSLSKRDLARTAAQVARIADRLAAHARKLDE